ASLTGPRPAAGGGGGTLTPQNRNGSGQFGMGQSGNPGGRGRGFAALLKSMRWNLVWYVPLLLATLLWLFPRTVGAGLDLLHILSGRWSWGILFSPAAAFFFSALTGFVFVPPWIALFFVPNLFQIEAVSSARRGLMTVLAVTGIFILPLVFWFLMWGSFP